MYGRREGCPGHIGHPPGKKYITKEYNKLATMCWIICKPQTPYTKNLIVSIHAVLDKHLNMLKKYPAKKPQGYYSAQPFNLAPKNSYPLRWLEVMGEIFHPLMLKYTNNIKFGIPDAQSGAYK